jgi:hypothetical protein
MKKDSALQEKTSRRAFTKAVVATLATAPIAASMIGCGKPDGGHPETVTTAPSPAGTATPTSTPRTPPTIGYTATSCEFPVIQDEHIPPMGIDGGGSVHIETKNKFKRTGSGSGPFTYLEDDGVTEEDRFGDLIKARIITETDASPFVTDVAYSGFLPGTQLLLWYQDISAVPGDPDDTTFPPVTFPDADPTVRIRGGKGADHFQMVFKRKSLSLEKSHKRVRPHRYKHLGGSGLAREFRIGQWRFVDKNGNTLVENKGAVNYHFFLFFADFQP